MCSKRFIGAVRELFSKTDKTIIATIPISSSIPLVNELKTQKDVKIFDTRINSIDNIKNTCLELLKNQK
jgi:nucleoside-triphosphatase THEP1